MASFLEYWQKAGLSRAEAAAEARRSGWHTLARAIERSTLWDAEGRPKLG